MSHLLLISLCLTDKRWCGRRTWITAGTFSSGLHCSSELGFLMFMPNLKIIYWHARRVTVAKIMPEFFVKNIKRDTLCPQVTGRMLLRGTLCLSKNGTKYRSWEKGSAFKVHGRNSPGILLFRVVLAARHLQIKQGFAGNNDQRQLPRRERESTWKCLKRPWIPFALKGKGTLEWEKT